MVILSANSKTVSSEGNCFSESRRSMHSRATMEMNSLEINSKSLYFLHSFMNILFSLKIISKLTRKRSSKLVSCFLLYSDSPHHSHCGSVLLYLHKFIDRVCSGRLDSITLSPLQVTFVLYRIRVNDILPSGSHIQYCLQFSPRGTVEARTT
jgi:hypothetical protein